MAYLAFVVAVLALLVSAVSLWLAQQEVEAQTRLNAALIQCLKQADQDIQKLATAIQLTAEATNLLAQSVEPPVAVKGAQN